MRYVGFALVVLTAMAGVSACGSSSPEASAAGRVASPEAQPAPPAPATGAAQPAGAPPSDIATPESAPVPATSSPAPEAPAAATTPVAPAQATPTVEPSSAGAIHRVGETAVTKAIELRVEGVQALAEIGGRRARPGYEFVIVDTLWKNIIPLKAINKKANASPTGGLGGFSTGRRPPPEPGDVTMEPTMYVVSMPKRQFWLFSDDRFGEMPDAAAHNATPDHLPLEGFSLAKLDDTLRGKVVFEAPAAATYRTFQYYDTDHGYALFALGGSKPASPPPTLGPGRENKVLHLAVTESVFRQSDPPPPPGLRSYVLGLRGISRSWKDIVDVPFQQFVYLQTDQGCVVQPERDPSGLTRPFDSVGSFPPTSFNEGQLAFLVPADTKAVKLLFRPASYGGFDLPTASDFTPTWPKPAHTFVDGTTMRVHVLPAPATPSTLAPAAEGRRHVVLDVVVENLGSRSGIEFQPIQLRLVTPAGQFIEPSPASADVPCRLTGAGVIPASALRRFTLVYDIGSSEAARLHYRGFELNEETADLP